MCKSWVPSIPNGYLEYQSSKIDWCENNYTVNPYIVEFMNTISNIPILLIALWSYVEANRALQSRNPSLPVISVSQADTEIWLLFAPRKRLPTTSGNHTELIQREPLRLQVLRLIFILIPIFSGFFHATLSYLGQITDEIAILIFVILLEPDKVSRLIETGLSLFVLFTIPSLNRFLLLTYGFLTAYKYYRSHRADRYWCYNALTLFGSSVIFWLTDIFFCDYLSISLHWVWHLLSGLGIYCSIKIVESMS